MGINGYVELQAEVPGFRQAAIPGESVAVDLDTAFVREDTRGNHHLN